MVVPSGAVSLLFTDIEASTRLWESDPAAMARAVERHDGLLRGLIERANGYVFKTVGDAFCAAFSDPRDAVETAAAVQRAVADEPWPTERPLRVRVGVHAGVCEERDGDYFGPVVNRAARLTSIAHGGQSIVSEAIRALVVDRLPAGVSLRDLGEHRLKDLGHPERVWQVDIEGLDSRFPPLLSLDNPQLRTNIPAFVTSFLGREREVSELVEHVSSGARLVTIVGPGGVGKTRLAQHAAIELLDGTGDGVWFVDLANVTDPSQVVASVMQTLAIRDDPSRDRLDHFVEVAANLDALIILDNCEHVIDDAAKLADRLLQSCAGMHLIATSREPLQVDGELVYRLDALALPDVDADLDAIARSAAVVLFQERASKQLRTFVVDDRTGPLVAEVCRRLDGVPLAIELAAARLDTMTLEQLASRLDRRFRLLVSSSRSRMARQRTLEALIGWSWDLLHDSDRAVLGRASVFAGSFDVDAAQAVCADDAIGAWDVADLVGSLVAKSLIQLGADGRYQLLESVRAYASERVTPEERQRAEAQHAAYFTALAAEARPHLFTHDQAVWFARLTTEHPNLLAALRHELDLLPAAFAQMASDLKHYWKYTGTHDEIASLLDRSLSDPAVTSDPHVHGLVLNRLIWEQCWLGRFDVARAHAPLALRLARDVADPDLLVNVLCAYADPRMAPEATARSYADEAVKIAREVDNAELLVLALANATVAYGLTGELAMALAYMEEVTARAQQLGDAQLLALTLSNRADADLQAGAVDTAKTRLHEALDLVADFYPAVQTLVRTNLGLAELLDGDRAAARGHFAAVLQLARRHGLLFDLDEALFGYALVTDDAERAAVLHGAVRAMRERRGEELQPFEERLRDEHFTRLQGALGEDRLTDLLRRGAELSRPEAIALARLR